MDLSRLTIIVCVFVVNYLEIFDFKPDLNGDNVYYYALGRAIARRERLHEYYVSGRNPSFPFPTGLPPV